MMAYGTNTGAETGVEQGGIASHLVSDPILLIRHLRVKFWTHLSQWDIFLAT